MFERDHRYNLRKQQEDDIAYCRITTCRRKNCQRNQMHIRDKTAEHKFYVERPPDCPYRKKQDEFYHIRKYTEKRENV